MTDPHFINHRLSSPKTVFRRGAVVTKKQKTNPSRLWLVLLGVFLWAGQAQAKNPLNIDALIAQAVNSHPLVGSAQADKQATQSGVKAAKLNFLPAPTLTAQHNQEQGATTSLLVRQSIWTGGRLTADVNRAISDDKAAFAKILERQNEVAKNTIDIWQGYIYAVSLQQLYLENLEQLAEFEAMMKRRVAQGISANIELDLITNRILQDQNALQGAIEQQRIAEARLLQLIGEPIGKTQELDMAALSSFAKANSAQFGVMAFADLSDRHPAVVRQKYEIEAAKYVAKAQEASRYPAVYVQYRNDYSHKTHRFEDNISIGLNIDPGAGLSSLALAQASNARVQSLMQSQQASKRAVMEGIQTQYQQFVSAKDQELSLLAAVSGAQIVLNSYRRQFVAGRKSWLEVLNAVREKTQYEQQLRQTQAQMIASFYKLQVDFGLMSWQQQAISQMNEESTPYRLFDSAQNYLKRTGLPKNHVLNDFENPSSTQEQTDTQEEKQKQTMTLVGHQQPSISSQEVFEHDLSKHQSVIEQDIQMLPKNHVLNDDESKTQDQQTNNLSTNDLDTNDLNTQNQKTTQNNPKLFENFDVKDDDATNNQNSPDEKYPK